MSAFCFYLSQVSNFIVTTKVGAVWGIILLWSVWSWRNRLLQEKHLTIPSKLFTLAMFEEVPRLMLHRSSRSYGSSRSRVSSWSSNFYLFFGHVRFILNTQKGRSYCLVVRERPISPEWVSSILKDRRLGYPFGQSWIQLSIIDHNWPKRAFM